MKFSAKYIAPIAVILLGQGSLFSQGPLSKDDGAFDEGSFKDVPVEFRPVPFWSWNETMRPDEVRRQVGLIKEGGWGGAFVHSRVGLITEYMSDEWFEAVDATIDECVKQGIKVFLYDEDKWPSGFSGGTVPLADDSFRPKAIVARKAGDKIPEGCEPIGKPFGDLNFYLYTTPLGDPWFNGTSYIDTMDRAAVAKFLDEAYQRYYDRYSEHYGKAIVAEFTDEPCAIMRYKGPTGAVPFSAKFLEEFKKTYGYDALENIHKLFADVEGAGEFRMHWLLLNDKMFEENFSKQLGDWCAAHGIDFTGHYMLEGSPKHMRLWGDSVMQNYRHQGIPGVDLLKRSIEERSSAKQCQSIVNQYGKRRMLCEIYGVSGGSLTFEDRQWLALQQICLGVNLLNPHLSLYTMSGVRKRDYPQNIYYQQCWWPLNSQLDIPLSRLCYAMSRGSYDADVLLLHISRGMTPMCQYGTEQKTLGWNQPGSFAPEAENYLIKCDEQWRAAVDELLANQVSFDLGDEVVMEDISSVENGKLKVGKSEYSVVVIPGMDSLSAKTFALLKKFKDEGGKVFKLENAPVKIDAKKSPEFEKWMESIELLKAGQIGEKVACQARKNARIASLKEGDNSLVWTHVRNLSDGSRIVLVVNLNRRSAFKGTMAFAEDKEGAAFSRVRKMDFHSGNMGEIFAKPEGGELFVEADIPPAGAGLYLLDKTPAAAKEISYEDTSSEKLHAVSVERLDDNALTLDYAAWAKSLDARNLSKGTVPVIKIQNLLNSQKYDGPLTLAYYFKTDGLDKGRKLHLVMEHPERAKVLVNGREAKYEGLPFWRDINWLPIDISGLVKEGLNQIIVSYENFEHGDLAVLKPAYKRYGTEIESVYIVGDFSVNGRFTGENPHSILLEPRKLPKFDCAVLVEDSIALGNPGKLEFGNVSVQGLPFYAGRVKYKFRLPEFKLAKNEKAIIKLDRLDTSVAEVVVDGKRAGAIFCAPYELDISSAAKSGSEVDIILYANMRNLLGPSHLPNGDSIDCGPGHFSPRGVSGREEEFMEKWATRKWKPGGWTDNYTTTSLGDVGAVSFKKRAAIEKK